MKPYTIFLGDVAQDEYYQVKKWPGRATKTDATLLGYQMGGMIANAACVYANYGKRTLFSGILNPNDQFLCNMLNSEGIDTHLVIYDPAVKESKCLVFLSEGEHTVFIIDTELNNMWITTEMQRTYCAATTIYSAYWQLKCMRTKEKNSMELIREWYQHNVRLVIDSDVDQLTDEDKKFLPFTHTLFMNETGFQRQQQGQSVNETIHYLRSFGLKILVVTLAENGCLLCTEQGNIHIPGVPTTTVDVTGAGDTFCSSFTYFYEQTENPLFSAYFATFASSLAVTQMGARSGAVGTEAVFRYMQEKGHNPLPYRNILK